MYVIPFTIQNHVVTLFLCGYEFVNTQCIKNRGYLSSNNNYVSLTEFRCLVYHHTIRLCEVKYVTWYTLLYVVSLT